MIALVTSNKMEKALVVTVFSTKLHTKYKKRFKVKKNYKVSCLDSSKFNVGDKVEIESCRPVSKTISWKVVEK